MLKVSRKKAKFILEEYTELIDNVCRAEYRRMRMTFLIDFSEILNIGSQAILSLSKNDAFRYYNASYLSTAIKWAIRNEVRRRYKWYISKFNSKDNLTEDILLAEKNDIKGAVFNTVLSLDDVAGVNTSAQELKDTKNLPAEYVEFKELRAVLEEAVKTLPQRERELIEAKFFKEKKLVELSDEFGISASRITRIIQTGLAKLKVELERKNFN